MPGWNKKNECIVTHHTLIDATPVGASINIFLSELIMKSLIRVDLPVHAFHVRKIDSSVCSIKSYACCP